MLIHSNHVLLVREAVAHILKAEKMRYAICGKGIEVWEWGVWICEVSGWEV